MSDETQPVRKGGTSGDLHRLDALRVDEMTIIDTMRRLEQQQHPGIMIVYYNGSNWMLYEAPQARRLPRT